MQLVLDILLLLSCVSHISTIRIELSRRSIAALHNIPIFLTTDFSKDFLSEDDCKLKTKIGNHKVYSRESTEEPGAVRGEEEGEEGEGGMEEEEWKKESREGERVRVDEGEGGMEEEEWKKESREGERVRVDEDGEGRG